MSFHLTVEPEFLRLEFHGTVTRDDLDQAVEAVETVERTAQTTPHRLSDFTDATLGEVATGYIVQLAERRKATTVNNPIKSAIVAMRPVNVGFARMFQMLNDHPQITIRIFQTEIEARAWLEEA
jgi:hypothetical protein